MIANLEGICTDDHDQKLINCLSRGGLTAVHNGCLVIFLRAEELFRKDTMGNPHKIDVADMVDQLTKNLKLLVFSTTLLMNLELKIFCQNWKLIYSH